MNAVQIIRKALLGCDAILPGSTASSLWQTDELLDLATQANDDLNLRLRLVRKKYGLVTVTSDSADIIRDGETYSPATNLAPTTGATSLELPPDFAEIVKIKCTNVTTVRFKRAEFEGQYWVENEQSALEEDGSFFGAGTGQGMTYFYDVTGDRTLTWTPPLDQQLDLSLSYIPMKRPLYYSNTGTIDLQNGSVIVKGAGTTWMSDGLYAEDSDHVCELIVGVSSLTSSSIRLDRDYPKVARFGSDLQFELARAYPGATASAQPFILAMVPTLPRVYHRWIAELMSAFMLRKVNPDLADKYAGMVMTRFGQVIEPTASVRQSQESAVTDQDESFGGISD